MIKKKQPILIIIAVFLILLGTVGLVLNKYFTKLSQVVIEQKNEVISTIDAPIILSGDMVKYTNDDYEYKVSLPKEVNNRFADDNYYDVFYKDPSVENIIYSLIFYVVQHEEEKTEETFNLLDNLEVGEELIVSASPYDDSVILYEKLSQTKDTLTVYIEPRLNEADNRSSLKMLSKNDGSYYILDLAIYNGTSNMSDEEQLNSQKKLFNNVVNSYELLTK
jgi:hypothetical protein